MQRTCSSPSQDAAEFHHNPPRGRGRKTHMRCLSNRPFSLLGASHRRCFNRRGSNTGLPDTPRVFVHLRTKSWNLSPSLTGAGHAAVSCKCPECCSANPGMAPVSIAAWRVRRPRAGGACHRGTTPKAARLPPQCKHSHSASFPKASFFKPKTMITKRSSASIPLKSQQAAGRRRAGAHLVLLALV